MHDGSSICEMLSLTLERVHRIAVETGRSFPRTVLLSSDNTVRESKKQITLMLLANLTAQYKCRVTGLVNLRKSHTHDKLDGPLAVENEVFSYCFQFVQQCMTMVYCEFEFRWTRFASK